MSFSVYLVPLTLNDREEGEDFFSVAGTCTDELYTRERSLSLSSFLPLAFSLSCYCFTHSLAVFPPSFAPPPPPTLEQFDLDQVFASPRTQLARLFHKCASSRLEGAKEGSREDLSYFVREAAEVRGSDKERNWRKS